jgi:hypothetical protein
MKKSFYFFALLGLLFVLPACQKEVVVEDNGLTSPSGQRLADSYDELGEMVEFFYETELNYQLTTKVKSIEWGVVGSTEVAILKHVSYDGVELSFAALRQVNGQSHEQSGDGFANRVEDVTKCKNTGCSVQCSIAEKNWGGWIVRACVCIVGGNEVPNMCEIEIHSTGVN